MSDLLRELVAALEAAQRELAALPEAEIPLGDELVGKLRERDALAETLKAVPDHLKAALRVQYREELGIALRRTGEPSLRIPDLVLDEVTRQVDAALSRVRREARLDPALDAALDFPRNFV